MHTFGDIDMSYNNSNNNYYRNTCNEFDENFEQ